MSCEKSTAPINIPLSSSVYPCDLKCTYNFSYGNSNCTLTNEQNFLRLSYDKNSSAKTINYNKIPLYIQEVRLYKPSLHRYQGKKADGELLIIHGGNGTNLIVSVPIMQGSKISTGGGILNYILEEGLPRVTNLGESTSLNIDNYNLDYIVPKKPFYSYTGTLLYEPCNGKYNYVVFDKSNAVQISSSALKNFGNIISPLSVQLKTNQAFYNKLGPNVENSGDDQIYIECNPTGSDGEVLLYNDKTHDMGDYSKQFDEFLESPIFKLLTAVGIIVILIGIYNMIVQRFIKKGGSKTTAIPVLDSSIT